MRTQAQTFENCFCEASQTQDRVESSKLSSFSNLATSAQSWYQKMSATQTTTRASNGSRYRTGRPRLASTRLEPVFHSSSDQINASRVQPAPILKKTYNRGPFLSREARSPDLEVATFLNNTKSGKSKISEGDPATVIETEPWRSLHYSCAHYKETSCLLTACPDILSWTHTLHWLNQRKTCSRDPGPGPIQMHSRWRVRVSIIT